MEFRYRISESEFVGTRRLRLKGTPRMQMIRSTLTWSIISGFLLLFFEMGRMILDQAPQAQQIAAYQALTAHASSGLTARLLSALLCAGIWSFLFFGLVPMRLRRLYHNDPVMRGEFTVHLSAEGILIWNSAGTRSESGWNIYEYWRESKGIILLASHSGAYFLLATAALSAPQRAELRQVLAGVLPKK